MLIQNQFMYNVKVTAALSNTAGDSSATGDRVSLENYERCGILVKQYQAGANAGAITVDMYTAYTGGTTSSGITFDYWYMIDVTAGTTADTWTHATAYAATIATSAASSGTSYYWIDINAADLFASGVSYPFVAVLWDGGGHASNIITADYYLYNPRSAQSALVTAQS